MGGPRLSRADWPPRSRIRGVAPIGLGSGWVESQSSLLVRTAYENDVSVRVLLDRVLPAAGSVPAEPGRAEVDLARLGRDLLRQPGAAVNGGWATARAMTEALTEATRLPGLAATTTAAWGEMLLARGLLRDERAYCPSCFASWARGGEPLYEPLKWQFKALEWCVEHLRPLRTECATPGCGRPRRVLSGWASMERCVECRRPFAEAASAGPEAAPTADELDWAKFVDESLSDILAAPPADDRPSPAPFSAILAVAVESAGAGSQREFAERIGMTEASVSYWKSGWRTPSLAASLRVSRAAGLRLRDVLTGDLRAVRATPAPAVRHYVAPSLEVHRLLDEAEMRVIIEEASVALPPPTLASVYADPRVNGTWVRRKWPAECAAIRDRRAAWERDRRAEVRRDRTAQIEAAVRRLTELGIYPARNQMKELVPGVWLRRPEFERAWKQAVVASGWPDPSEVRRIRGEPTPIPVRRTAVGTKEASRDPLA